jgi:hypothetical protein
MNKFNWKFLPNVDKCISTKLPEIDKFTPHSCMDKYFLDINY